MIDSLDSAGIHSTLLRMSGCVKNPSHPERSTSDALQVEDAELTVDAIRAQKPQWLVVDHYKLSATWENVVRPHVGRILVIDDLADRNHDCDLLLDQNYSDAPADRYDALTPAGCHRLLGPRFALLHRDYAEYRLGLTATSTPRDRILVFFGGTDEHNLTGLALEAISMNGLVSLPSDIVVGANNPNISIIEEAARLRPNTRFYGPRPNLADLMATAGLSIGAGGTTTWERLCLRVPSLVASVADNQVPTSKALARAGLIHYLGSWESVTAVSLNHAATELMAKKYWSTFYRPETDLVDGLGSARVIQIMISSIL
jgi:UDP-2,4-diacetamido-2,4,6-trideoxy-beta-L-altropyranose hydrolase